MTSQSTDPSPYFVGMDVHKASITIAVYRGGSSECFEKRMPNDLGKVRRFMKKLLKEAPVRACYEASGCGYVLYRALIAIGVDCQVIAPSLVPKRSGDRRKTDSRDARGLGSLLRAGLLTPIHIPSTEEESLRDLVRYRETMRGEVHRSKQHVLKLLLRHGLRSPTAKHWTGPFWTWLRKLELPGFTGETLQMQIALLSTKIDQLAAIDRRLEEVWRGDDRLRGPVGRLRCLRGIDTLSAMVLATEIVDIMRFASPRALMGWLGLTVSEDSSGEVKSYLGITKTGNARCRRILVEAAWQYRHKPAVYKGLAARQADQSPAVVAHANRAQRRLHRRLRYLQLRKDHRKAVTAVARELAGFVWAIMHDDPQLRIAQPRP